MGIWASITEALGLAPVPDAIQATRLIEAAGATVDADDIYYRPLSGQQEQRDLTPLDQARMQKLAYFLWESNGIANRLIELPLAYLLAEGVRLSAKDKQAQEWLDAFWSDPVNRLNRRFKEYIRAWKIFGELCLPTFTNEVSGAVRLGYIDPASIDAVVKDPDNPALEIGVIVRPRLGGDRRLYRIILGGPDEELLGPQARRLRQGMVHGECFYWRRNALPNSSRGRSDLLASIDHCDAYEQLLFGEVERAAALRQVVYDVTLKGATKEEVETKARTIHTPKPLSTRVHNDSEIWDTLTPDMKAGDASETARLIRGHIMGAKTLPEHWMGIGGDVNRATGESMAEPTFKVLTEEQNEVQAILVDLGTYVIAARLERMGLRGYDRLAPEMQVTAEMPDLSSRDVTKFTSALASAVAAVSSAIDRGLMTEETGMRLIALIAAQMGLEIDPAEELIAARRQTAARRAADGFGGETDDGFDAGSDLDGEDDPDAAAGA